MGWLDPELLDALAKADSDPEQAAQLLRIAARYLREGKPLPRGLDVYLADAFEAAMHKPEKDRGKALALELNLSALNRRPAAYWLEVGEWMSWETTPDGGRPSQNELATRAAVEFGISESTAISYYRKLLRYYEEQAKEEAEWFAEMLKRKAEEEARDQAEQQLNDACKKPIG